MSMNRQTNTIYPIGDKGLSGCLGHFYSYQVENRLRKEALDGQAYDCVDVW